MRKVEKRSGRSTIYCYISRARRVLIHNLPEGRFDRPITASRRVVPQRKEIMKIVKTIVEKE
jgi:hypothetical protein